MADETPRGPRERLAVHVSDSIWAREKKEDQVPLAIMHLAAEVAALNDTITVGIQNLQFTLSQKGGY